MDEIEVPEPYRSDLRFTYLIWTVASLLQKSPPKIQDIYTDMRQLFTTVKETKETSQDALEAAFTSWAESQGGKVKRVSDPGAE